MADSRLDLNSWQRRMKRFVLCCLLLFPVNYCTGCAPSVVSNKTKVPGHLLLPVEHPVVTASSVTVEDLLHVIRQYEDKLELVNDRFAEIQYIQSDVKPQASNNQEAK